MKLLIGFIVCVIFMVIVEKKRGGDFDGAFGCALAGLIMMFLLAAKSIYGHP